MFFTAFKKRKKNNYLIRFIAKDTVIFQLVPNRRTSRIVTHVIVWDKFLQLSVIEVSHLGMNLACQPQETTHMLSRVTILLRYSLASS